MKQVKPTITDPVPARPGGAWINSPECDGVLIEDIYNITPQEVENLRKALNVDAFVQFVGLQAMQADSPQGENAAKK